MWGMRGPARRGGAAARQGTGQPGGKPTDLTTLSANSGLVNSAELNKWLEDLKVEHRDLDEVIHHLIETGHHDTMRIQRLKKRKLRLKDMMAKLQSELIPDLDA